MAIPGTLRSGPPGIASGGTSQDRFCRAGNPLNLVVYEDDEDFPNIFPQHFEDFPQKTTKDEPVFFMSPHPGHHPRHPQPGQDLQADSLRPDGIRSHPSQLVAGAARAVRRTCLGGGTAEAGERRGG